MKITVVLPYNNPLSSINTKPVVLATLPYSKYSKFYSDITIISSYTKNPIQNFKFIILPKDLTKKHYKLKVLENINKIQPKTIEVHQDVKLAAYLAKYTKVKVVVVKHGNYLINSFADKILIIRKFYEFFYLAYLEKVLCISNYVRDTLAGKYPDMKSKFITIYNSLGYLPMENLSNKVCKEDIIIFAGKPVFHKGIIPLLEALPGILVQNKAYKVELILGFFSNKIKYNKQVLRLLQHPELQSLIREKRIILYERLSNSEVLAKMQKAKIAIVPTIKAEPFGLVALEAHLAKCAVISSGTGGLREISEDKALYLQAVNKAEITLQVNKLINNQKLLQRFSIGGYNNVVKKFSATTLVTKLDTLRENFYKVQEI